MTEGPASVCFIPAVKRLWQCNMMKNFYKKGGFFLK